MEGEARLPKGFPVYTPSPAEPSPHEQESIEVEIVSHEETLEPEFEVKNYAKELNELYANGVIDTEKYKWLREVLNLFEVNPVELINWEEKPLPERLRVLGLMKLKLTVIRERWINECGMDWEKAADRNPPPSYVAEVVADAAKKLRLIEPVLVWLGEQSEIMLKVGRRVHVEKDFKEAARKLALAVKKAAPEYSVIRLASPLNVALAARAEPLERGKVNPREYLNCANGVVDLKTLTFHEDTGHVFTYELPPVDPMFLMELKQGRVEEGYFVGRPFYQVLRKHYEEGEWVKLKRVLGAILVPRTMKLIAIVVGPKDTRKTFLYNLLMKTLKGLAAAVRLRDITEDRFALQHALGARVLITSEEAQTIVSNIDRLKSISGGDPQPVDRKFLPRVTLEDNPLKVLIFSNDMPVFKKWDDAFMDRLVIISTENPEKPSKWEQLSIEEALMRLREFLCFLLYCYWELVQSGYEIPEKGSEKYVQVLVEAQSNVFDFASELLEGELVLNRKGVKALLGKGYSTEGSLLYDIYCEWARLRGEAAEPRNTFYQLLEQALREKGIVRINARKVTFRGIKVIMRGPEEVELPFS